MPPCLCFSSTEHLYAHTRAIGWLIHWGRLLGGGKGIREGRISGKLQDEEQREHTGQGRVACGKMACQVSVGI